MEIKASGRKEPDELDLELAGAMYYIFMYIAKKSGKPMRDVLSESLSQFAIPLRRLFSNEEELTMFLRSYSAYAESVGVGSGCEYGDFA